MLAKILTVPLTFPMLKDREGLIVARETSLVRIKKVAFTKEIQYSFLDAPNEIVYGKFNMVGFYMLAAWAFKTEESEFFEIAQKDIVKVAEFVAKDKNGRFITSGDARYKVPRVNIHLDENRRAYLEHPF